MILNIVFIAFQVVLLLYHGILNQNLAQFLYWLGAVLLTIGVTLEAR